MGQIDTDFEKQEERIKKILGKHGFHKSLKTLEVYFDYLENNIDNPCIVTGIEDFQWEEFYVFGPGDKEEYEELKKHDHLTLTNL